MEWPRDSGKLREFPEIDKAGWFSIEKAAVKILRGQMGLLQQLQKKLVGRRKDRIEDERDTGKG
jgi:predicted NUDIX family NTP pyrophosphohydrolase